jgi:hypothetical protein
MKTMTKRPLIVTIDFGGLDPSDGEFESVEDFVEYLMDDDRTEFDWRHLNCLSSRTGKSNRALKHELERWGFTLAERRAPKRCRGFNTNSHDRWYGPGSSKTHGGSGWEEITGMAGRKG